MEFVVICVVALVVAAMTLVSGFGLGTLLMPAFALFFPVPVAVAATAVVHLANNIFKVLLVGRLADRRVVLRFALPAALSAIGGALLLEFMADAAPLVTYTLGGSTREITPVKLVIAVLIVGFAILELTPRFEKLAIHPKYIPLAARCRASSAGCQGIKGRRAPRS